MRSVKRLHDMQHKPQDGKPGLEIAQTDESSPATKRLKSSHDTHKDRNIFASLLDTNSSNRKKLGAVTTNGVASKASAKVDESRTTVATNLNGATDDHNKADNLSSDDDSEDDAEDTDSEEEDAVDGAPLTNGVHAEDVPVEDIEMTNGVDGESEEEDGMDGESEEEDGGLSFGDMLKARHPEVINVHAQLPDPHAEPPHLMPAAGKDALIRPLTGHSLATVLQQALKTNDKDMLESCFHLRDMQAIRNTIQRLPSPLVGNLLTRISERMYKRPGRIGSLMIWVQWSLVAHGGYIATQPEILRKLKALNQVIKQRAQGLQSLIQLKGKLDMLSAQLDLRRGLETQRQRADAAAEEDGVLYVEAEDEDGSQGDDQDTTASIKAQPEPIASEEEADNFNPIQQDDSDDEEKDQDNEQDMLDLEAEETDDDEGEDESEEDSEDASDVEDLEDEDEDEDEDDESEDEVKAPKPQILNRKR